MNKQKVDGGIEWTHVWGYPGMTWNPIAGCNHGCAWRMKDGQIASCYAKDIAERFSRAYPHGFEHNYWHPQRLSEPLKLLESAGIFLGSMSDAMEWRVERDHIERVLDVCRRAPQHVFFLLTKNAPRLLEFSFPPNVWVGVSSPPDFMHDPESYSRELSDRAKENYMRRAFVVLSKVDALVKWISYEPLQMDFSRLQADHPGVINWAVIGAASNGSAVYPPRLEDYTALMRVLANQDVPVFFKGNMKSLPAAAADWHDHFPDKSWYMDRLDHLRWTNELSTMFHVGRHVG